MVNIFVFVMALDGKILCTEKFVTDSAGRCRRGRLLRRMRSRRESRPTGEPTHLLWLFSRVFLCINLSCHVSAARGPC